MIDVTELCPSCGGKMEDGGALDEYYDPYSPYIEATSGKYAIEDSDKCIHLIYCPFCGKDIRKEIKTVLM